MNSPATGKKLLHRSKPRWPNPKDSIGDLFQKMGSRSCWEAVGKAREAFLIISPEIKAYLVRNSDRPRHEVKWSIYMIGRSEQKAEPFIMFCCEDIGSRRLVRGVVEESKILDKYPGVKVGDCERAPDFDRIEELAYETSESKVTAARRQANDNTLFALDKCYYTPLDSSVQEFRLLRIDPGKEASVVACNLLKTSLKDPQIPKYLMVNLHPRPLALPAYSAYIRLNGTVCEIPVEIAESLRLCRSETSAVTIWMERLCVNQNSIEETRFIEEALHAIAESSTGDLYLDNIAEKTVLYQPSQTEGSKQILISNFYKYPYTIRKATAGATFRSGDRYFFMTVAHVFVNKSESPPSLPRANNDTFVFDIGDDDSSGTDEEPRRLTETTSKGSLTPEPTEYANSETTSSCAETPWDHPTRSHEAPVVTEETSTKGDETQSSGLSQSMPPVADKTTISLKPLAFVGKLASPSLVGSTLDYSLIEIQEPELQTFNAVVSSTESKTVLLFPQRVLPTLPSTNISVFAITGSADVLKGTLSGTPTFTSGPRSTTQELWTVRLDGKLSHGDCGSLIIDAENGDVVGHIISGSRDTGVAYIIPAYQALEDAQEQLHIDLTLATRANSMRDKQWAVMGSQSKPYVQFTSYDGPAQPKTKGKGVAAPDAEEAIPTKAAFMPPGVREVQSNSLNSWLSNMDNMNASSTYVGTSSTRFSGLSTPSNRSRVSVVENDPAIDTSTPFKIRIIEQPKYKWYDHLKGVFGVDLSRKRSPTARVPIKTQDVEEDQDSSPFIVPVYVLSSRHSEQNVNIPKEAKCNIDTGNYQGNFVSRDFVENVLGMDRSIFAPLSKQESRGGIGIMGNLIVPEGAIYLTWYHKNSTRVFRNMRFLVLPYKTFDLNIGANSIRTLHLLDIPNFAGWKEQERMGAIRLGPKIAEVDELAIAESSKSHSFKDATEHGRTGKTPVTESPLKKSQESLAKESSNKLTDSQEAKNQKPKRHAGRWRLRPREPQAQTI